MTIGEYIEKKIGQLNLGIPKDISEEVMVGLDIVESAQLDKEGLKQVDLFFYTVIPELLIKPLRVSEGQYSVGFDKDAIIAYYSMLARKLGLDDNLSEMNRITDITDRW